MLPINRQLFRDTLLSEFRSAWQTLRQSHPTEHFYSFGLYTTALASYLTVTASTEEGLSLVTAEYLASSGGDPMQTRAALRWSPCDSPLHQEGADLLPRSQLLRDNGPDPYDDTIEGDEAIDLVFEVSVEVLKQLDNEKVFGSGDERANLVLGIWMGDQSDEERIAFAQELNPKLIVDRFAAELEEE